MNRFTFIPQFSSKSWLLMRWAFGLYWLACVPYALFAYHSQPVPTGLANYIDVSVLSHPVIASFFTAIAIATFILYIKQRGMVWTTLVMFVLAVLSQTLLDSQGAFHRNELLALIALGQFFAYAISSASIKGVTNIPGGGDLRRNDFAILFSRQAIIAAYFLSGITKLQVSGIYWVIDSPNAVLQFAKSFYELYYTFDVPFVPTLVQHICNFWVSHQPLLIVTMAIGLLLELMSPLAMLGNRAAKAFGILMILFHLGIAFIMGILFLHYLFILAVFFLLPKVEQKELRLTSH